MKTKTTTDTSKNFILLSLCTFILLTIYFVIINPIPIFDTDDWEYIHNIRIPVPMVRVWNPIKVFPEFTQPIISYIGSGIFLPLTNDFCRSLTISHGIFISLILTLYFYEFFILIYKKISSDKFVYIPTGILFFLLHFIIFLQLWGNNKTMFYSYDLTCIYNYTLPTALNAALVMRLITNGGIEYINKNTTKIKFIVVLVWIYFALNSNLYSSIVLAAYISCEIILTALPEILAKSFVFKSFFNKHKIGIYTIGYWLFSHILEKTGMRSGSRVGTIPTNIVLTFINLFKNLLFINVFVLIFALLTFIFWLKKCHKNMSAIKKLIICLFITTAYIYLLSVVVNPSYINRIDVIFSIAFWILMGFMACFAKLLKTNKRYIFTPVILLGSIFMLFSSTSSIFAPVNYANLNYEKNNRVLADIISQFKEAESNGISEIDLVVPEFDTEDNWPIATYGKDRIALALYKHNVIHIKVNVRQMVVSKEKTKELIEN